MIAKPRTNMVAVAALIAAPLLAAPQTASAQTTNPSTTAPSLAAPSTTMPSATTRGGNTATGNPAFSTSDMQTRASKVIGSAVYNEQRQKIGTINDLLISNGHDVGTAVISVGGFLGIASKLIEVPYAQIRMQDNRLVMPGASKDQLKQLPQYKYRTSAS